MSRTLKALVVMVAVVAVLTLAVAGTVYTFGGDRCGSGESVCGSQHQVGCGGSGICGGTNDCTGSSQCNRNSLP
jgi:hypothetical protein